MDEYLPIDFSIMFVLYHENREIDIHKNEYVYLNIGIRTNK